MKSLTIVYATSRKEPHFEWFIDSLLNQMAGADTVHVLWIDLYQTIVEHKDYISLSGGIVHAEHRPIKPTVWQGPHRLTKADWWAKSNSLNTAICLCKTEWVCMVDDRCVLMPGWLGCIREAMAGGYAVAGSYEKRHGLRVENGIITDPGTMDGTDCRSPKGMDHRVLLKDHIVKAPGDWWFGCCNALPLGWALAANGYSEAHCDGIGMEDVCFGMTLANSGFPIRYDPRFKIVEDRTPDELGTPMRREDKGKSPNDKSHALVKHFKHAKTSGNSFDIRKLRDSVLAGEPFPPPSGSDKDWFDQQPLSEMT